MGRYVIRRLLQFVPTVLGTLFLLHYLTSLAIQFTGNPVRAIFGDRTPPPHLVEAIGAQMKLNDPCLTRRGDPCVGLYWDRLTSMMTGDFGMNFNRRPVTDIVLTALPYTVRLAVIALIVEIIVGIAVGVLAGVRGGSFWDYLVKVSTVLFIAVPVFVLGVAVQQFLGVGLGNWMRGQEWIPDLISRGVFTPAYKPEYPWASLVLPGLVLASTSLAVTARLTRTSIMENLRADYVRTARAKGLTGTRVIGVHTLRNSLIPVVTFLAVDLGALIGSAVITEGIFNVPGIGRNLLHAIRTGEPPVIIGISFLLVLVYLTANLLVDLLYAVLDPRIRYD